MVSYGWELGDEDAADDDGVSASLSRTEMFLTWPRSEYQEKKIIHNSCEMSYTKTMYTRQRDARLQEMVLIL